MTKYEKLLDKAQGRGISVTDFPFRSNIKGLYFDGKIALRDDMTDAEKNCVLSEEIGHHATSTGVILDQSKIENRKQELRARLWGYDQLIGLRGLIRAYEHGCGNRYEIAEFLEVTEAFLQDAVECYRDKYGTEIRTGNYIIFFEPSLMVAKFLKGESK